LIVKPTLLSVLFAFFCVSFGCAEDADEPLPEEFKSLTADQILELVRLSQALQDSGLSAHLRKGGNLIPVGISMRKGSILFKFQQPDEILELQLGDKGATLNRETRAGKRAVPKGDYGTHIRGTDVTYEDLSMRFLYWPKPALLGTVRLNLLRKCWKLRVTNPDESGPFSTVIVWVHQASGALLQMEGYGRAPSSNPIKRFRVTKVQKSKGAWILRQMVIETLNPKTRRSVGETTLNVRDPKLVK
jgi:hypothetical protein